MGHNPIECRNGDRGVAKGVQAECQPLVDGAIKVERALEGLVGQVTVRAARRTIKSAEPFGPW